LVAEERGKKKRSHHMSKEQQNEHFEPRNPNPTGAHGQKAGKQARMSYIDEHGNRRWHTGAIVTLLGKGPKVQSLLGQV
jgi:hypothetical protein